VEMGEQLRFRGGAVLEVDEDPIEARTPHELRRERRAEARPRSEQGLAAEHALAE